MKNTLTRFFNRNLLKVKKYSPEILLAVGIAGTVVGTVSACKSTLKIKPILEDKDEKVDKIHKCLDDEKIDYNQNDANKDLTLVYAQTGLKLVKLYSPALVIGGLSFTSIIAGQRILKKRNIAIAAAYAIMEKSFSRYRNNVVDRFGESVDRELRYNIKSQEIEVETKNGKKKKEKVEVVEADSALLQYSDYARFFDAASKSFAKDPEYNLMFLRRQQDYANEMLKARGHLFLNEVYDLLDIPRTKAGQVVGWIYDPKNNKNGDNYVDFGIYKDNEPNRRFINGLEYNILLDFNVDGVIYNLI
jgi:hypothetical protein